MNKKKQYFSKPWLDNGPKTFTLNRNHHWPFTRKEKRLFLMLSTSDGLFTIFLSCYAYVNTINQLHIIIFSSHSSLDGVDNLIRLLRIWTIFFLRNTSCHPQTYTSSHEPWLSLPKTRNEWLDVCRCLCFLRLLIKSLARAHSSHLLARLWFTAACDFLLEFEFAYENCLFTWGTKPWLKADNFFPQKKNGPAGFEPSTFELIHYQACINPETPSLGGKET